MTGWMMRDAGDAARETCSSCGRGTYTVPSRGLSGAQDPEVNRRIGPGVFTKRQEARTL